MKKEIEFEATIEEEKTCTSGIFGTVVRQKKICFAEDSIEVGQVVHVTLSPASRGEAPQEPFAKAQDEPDWKGMWEELTTEATNRHTRAMKQRHRHLEQFWFNLIRGLTKLKAKHTPQEEKKS